MIPDLLNLADRQPDNYLDVSQALRIQEGLNWPDSQDDQPDSEKQHCYDQPNSTHIYRGLDRPLCPGERQPRKTRSDSQ